MAPSESSDSALEDASVVICFGVLHHIPKVRLVIGEIARVMKPGALFLTCP